MWQREQPRVQVQFVLQDRYYRDTPGGFYSTTLHHAARSGAVEAAARAELLWASARAAGDEAAEEARERASSLSSPSASLPSSLPPPQQQPQPQQQRRQQQRVVGSLSSSFSESSAASAIDEAAQALEAEALSRAFKAESSSSGGGEWSSEE